MERFVIYIFLVIMAVQASRIKRPWDFKGTVPGIREIVLGRCYTYLELSSTNRKQSLTVNVDCKILWQKFRRAWANKDPCNVTEKSYQDFISLMDSKKTTKDQLLFWSGMSRLSGDLAAVNDNFYTLEKTFTGYITNNLQWCGCVDDGKTKGCVKGINYDNCERKDECSSSEPFWVAASRNFATKAEGTAHVMLNGTTQGKNRAYRLMSHFRRFELPGLGKAGRVEKLVIFVVFDLGVTPREKCGNGTIASLERDARKHGIKTVECIDNPRMIMNLLCIKFPEAKECVRENYKRNSSIASVFSQSDCSKNGRKETRYECVKCDIDDKPVPLCIHPCFREYHDILYAKNKQ